MQPIVIIGGSGFIGQSLLKLYDSDERAKLHILLRDIESVGGIDLSRVNIIKGDLTNEKSLDALLQPEAIVINLAFLEGADKSTNLKAINVLIKKCKSVGIKRFLHCSTSSVYGAVKETVITEETECHPKKNYEITKYEIENLLKNESLNNFELVIVRPTSVFGSSGKNLIKYVESLKTGNPIINYLRACLYWKRRMNLVSVETVASSIKYLSESNNMSKQEVFIVSADDVEKNNFYDIEKHIRKYLHINKYIIPILHIPSVFLKVVLWMRGRSNINPNSVYSNKKLYEFGFIPPKDFIESLYSYIKNQ